MLKKLLSFWIILFSLSIVIVPLNIVSADGDSSGEKEINIDILPNKSLFNIENMKPGDWAPRTVTVKNEGEKDFNYAVKIKNMSKTNKLYNELLLEISDSNGELYDGKLVDFTELTSRKLVSSKEEELNFTIRYPEKLENDFQGVGAMFSLVFVAEGELKETDEASSGGIINGDNSPGGFQLPKTSTNMFYLLLIGTVITFIGGSLLLYQKYRRIEKSKILN